MSRTSGFSSSPTGKSFGGSTGTTSSSGSSTTSTVHVGSVIQGATGKITPETSKTTGFVSPSQAILNKINTGQPLNISEQKTLQDKISTGAINISNLTKEQQQYVGRQAYGYYTQEQLAGKRLIQGIPVTSQGIAVPKTQKQSIAQQQSFIPSTLQQTTAHQKVSQGLSDVSGSRFLTTEEAKSNIFGASLGQQAKEKVTHYWDILTRNEETSLQPFEKTEKAYIEAATYGAITGGAGAIGGTAASAGIGIAKGIASFVGFTKGSEVIQEKVIEPELKSVFQKESVSYEKQSKQIQSQINKEFPDISKSLQETGKFTEATKEKYKIEELPSGEYKLTPKESYIKELEAKYPKEKPKLTTKEKAFEWIGTTTAGQLALTGAEIGAALLITKGAGKLGDFTLSKLPTQVKGVSFEPEIYVTKIEREASKQMGDFLITSPEKTYGTIKGTARIQTSKLGIFNKKDLEIPAMLEFEQVGKEAGVIKTQSKLFILGKEGEQFAGTGKGVLDFTTKEGNVGLKDFTMKGTKAEFGGLSETTFKVSGKQKETLLKQIENIDKDIAKTKELPLKKITYEEKTKQVRKLLNQKQEIKDYLEKPIVKRNLLEGSAFSFEELPKYKISKATSIEVKEPKTIFERGFLKIEHGEQITPDIFKTTKLPKTTSYNIFEKVGKVPTEVIEKEVLGLKFIEEDFGLKDIQVLYHGTTEKSAEKILKEGLKPAAETGIKRGITKPSEFVSLTTDFEAAKGFAGRAATKAGEKPFILEINVPKESIGKIGNLGEVELPFVKPEHIKGFALGEKLPEMPSGKFVQETKETLRSFEMQDIYQGAGVIGKAKPQFELKFDITTPKHLPYEEKVIEFGKPKTFKTKGFDILDLDKGLSQDLLTKQLSITKSVQPTGAIISKNILDTQIRNAAFNVPYEPSLYQRTTEELFIPLAGTKLPRANELIVGGINEHINQLKGFNLPVPSTKLETEFKFINVEQEKEILNIPSKRILQGQKSFSLSLKAVTPVTAQEQFTGQLPKQIQFQIQPQITEQPQQEKLRHPKYVKDEFFSITVPPETVKAPVIPLLPWFPRGRLFERSKKGMPTEVTPEYKPSLMALELGIKGKLTKEKLQKKELSGLQVRKLHKGFKFQDLPSLSKELPTKKMFGSNINILKPTKELAIPQMFGEKKQKKKKSKRGLY
jgi:hypothetical protein